MVGSKGEKVSTEERKDWDYRENSTLRENGGVSSPQLGCSESGSTTQASQGPLYPALCLPTIAPLAGGHTVPSVTISSGDTSPQTLPLSCFNRGYPEGWSLGQPFAQWIS